MTKDNSNKLIWIDIMKGILILLMVLGHTYVVYKEFIYLFHMAVFFMISGYCWSEKHANNAKSAGKYIIQKIIRLYIPFVLINILYILLNNIFIRMGIYSDSPEFLVLTSGAPVKQNLTEYYTLVQMIKGIIRTLCFAGGAARLCGATWFLSTIFMVSVFHCILAWIIEKVKWNKMIVYSIVMFICLAWAWLVDCGIITTIGAFDRFPSAYAVYIVGIIIKVLNKNEKYNSLINFERTPTIIVSTIISFGLLVAFYMSGFHVELAKEEISNPLGYMIVSICGWIFIKDIAILFSRYKLSIKVFQLLGNRTIPILLFHTLSFKIVSLFYLKITDGDKLLLASYPVIFTTGEWIKYLYLIVGIVVPLIIYKIYSVGKNGIVNKTIKPS